MMTVEYCTNQMKRPNHGKCSGIPARRTFSMLAATCAAAASLTLASCSGEGDSNNAGAGDSATAADVRAEAAEAARAAESFAQATVDEYKQKMRDAIAGMNSDIEDLQSRAESMTGEAKAQAEGAIEQLRAQRDALAARLDEVAADSADAWAEIKRGLDRAWQDLSDARKAAVDQIVDE